jgi:hypothetical protein
MPIRKLDAHELLRMPDAWRRNYRRGAMNLLRKGFGPGESRGARIFLSSFASLILAGFLAATVYAALGRPGAHARASSTHRTAQDSEATGGVTTNKTNPIATFGKVIREQVTPNTGLAPDVYGCTLNNTTRDGSQEGWNCILVNPPNGARSNWHIEIATDGSVWASVWNLDRPDDQCEVFTDPPTPMPPECS